MTKTARPKAGEPVCDPRVLQSPRASGPETSLLARQRGDLRPTCRVGVHESFNRREGGGAGAQQETRNPEGLCLTQQPPPVTGCVKVESHSACAPRLLQGRGLTYPHAALSRTLGRLPFAGGQLARHLPGRHSSVAARPLRCRTGLLRRRGSGRRHLVSSGGLFARKHKRTRPLSSMWGD